MFCASEELALNLMDEYISAPTMLNGLASVPFSLGGILDGF
jgi:hypothetical protein